MNKIWLKVIDHAPLNYNWFGCGPHVNVERQLSDNHKGKWQVCDLFLGQRVYYMISSVNSTSNSSKALCDFGKDINS